MFCCSRKKSTLPTIHVATATPLPTIQTAAVTTLIAISAVAISFDCCIVTQRKRHKGSKPKKISNNQPETSALLDLLPLLLNNQDSVVNPSLDLFADVAAIAVAVAATPFDFCAPRRIGATS